jgi:hypothetical protein
MHPLNADAIDKDLQSRADRIDRARKAYHGDFSKPLKIDPGEPDHNRISNRCKPIIMTNKSFLFGLPLQIVIAADDEESDAGNVSPAQEYLNQSWGDDNKRMTLLGKLYINGGLCGQGFLRIVEPNKAMGQQYPVVHVIDPASVSVMTYPSNVDVVSQYAVQYQIPSKTNAGEKDTFRQIILRNDPDGSAEIYGSDIDSTWTITTYLRPHGTHQFSVTDEREWPYSWSPLEGCQNAIIPNEYWGEEDITPDLIALNDGINGTNSDIAKVIYYHGSPMLYGAGARASEVTVGANRILWLPNPQAKIGSIEMTHGLADHMNFAASLRSDMAEQSGVPEVAVGRMDQLPRAVTGVALRILYAPEMASTEDRRRLYGQLIISVSQHMLELGGYGKDTEIILHWQDPLPSDDLAEAQTSAVWSGLGVSDSTLMQRGGFDPDEEAKLKDIENQSKTTLFDRGQGPPVMPPQQIPNNLPQQQNDGGQGVQ